MPPVIALIPAYDEAPRIAAVVTAAARHLPVLVVDDGSRDGTAEVAAGAGAEVIVQRPNQGKGAALRAGFHRALAEGAEAVLALDADGQHDPAEIPAFLAAHAATGAELIVGRRDFSRMPPVRRLANTLGGLLISWAVGRPIPDNQSGYRLIGRPLMERLLASEEGGFEFEVEMLARAIADRMRIEWVPIRTIYAGAPSHIRPLAHLRHFIRVTRMARTIVRGAPER